MDLDQLFINTDYKTTTVEIPCFIKVKRSSAKGETDEVLLIELACSNAASTDFDLTGQVLWPVSVLLGHYLASEQGRQLTLHKTVVELGAGCGLAGLVASNYARETILTDGNETVLDLLQQNVKRSEKKSTRSLSARIMVWGNRKHFEELLNQTASGQVDVVIAADVVQWPAVVEPLLHTVKALLWSSTQRWAVESNTGKTQEHQPAFVLGVVVRARSTFDLFVELAFQLGFHPPEKLEPPSYLSEGIIPPSCREHGGRQTEIYTLRLKLDAESPILLESDSTEQDLVVGKNYEGTLNLPF